MAVNYEINSVEGAVSYSGRKGRPPADITATQVSIEKKSPVWPLVAIVFATGFLQNGFWFAVACVLAQLSVMTALQWMALFAQRNASFFGLPPFRTIAALKLARFGAFAAALASALILG
ncbi:hypothetical protein [Sphingorhabdus sp.]|jgi:hypothetical protein|uniref:hypothetical protein n=1 Tax=Sphingorhabdus sp. TaxID=1902408 RepID=UPI0037C59E14